MKKILTILALASAATFGYAQGTVILQSSSAAYFISTNDLAGHIGVTTKTANSFDYAVLIAAYGGAAPADNPLDPAWSGAVLTGVNFAVTAGGIQGQGGNAGSAGTGAWGAPTAAGYTDATENYYIVVGWSSNLGANWATAKNNLATATGANFYGFSGLGYGFSGGGPNALPAPSLWGVSGAMPGGLSSGFQLTAVPEPATMALVGLGGLSVLLFRRRK